LTPDWWSRQYDSQVNQIWAKNLTSDFPWGDNGGYSGVFGLESNYPCCTVNHPQGYPKFWAHSFMADQALDTIMHIFLGPAQLSTTLSNNNAVNVTVDTLYPFASTLKYTITAAKPFTFSIRVPTYAQGNSGSTISVGNAKATPLTVNANSLHSISVKAGATTVQVTLAMPLEVRTVANGSVVVNRGPINYAVELPFNDTTTASWRNPQALSDTENLFPAVTPNYTTQFIPQDQDHTLLPTTDWRIAINPTTIKVVDNSAQITSLGQYPWAPGAQPITLTAKACNINWSILHNAAAPPPQSPNACIGSVFDVTLAPFGAAKLRLGQIPTMTKTA